MDEAYVVWGRHQRETLDIVGNGDYFLAGIYRTEASAIADAAKLNTTAETKYRYSVGCYHVKN